MLHQTNIDKPLNNVFRQTLAATPDLIQKNWHANLDINPPFFRVKKHTFFVLHCHLFFCCFGVVLLLELSLHVYRMKIERHGFFWDNWSSEKTKSPKDEPDEYPHKQHTARTADRHLANVWLTSG